MNSVKETVTVQDVGDGNVYIPIPEHILEKMGWNLGDNVKCELLEDGSISVKKLDASEVENKESVDTEDEDELLEVQTTSTFTLHYGIKVKKSLSLEEKKKIVDDVIFGVGVDCVAQHHLGETIEMIAPIEDETFIKKMRNIEKYLTPEIINNTIVDRTQE